MWLEGIHLLGEGSRVAWASLGLLIRCPNVCVSFRLGYGCARLSPVYLTLGITSRTFHEPYQLSYIPCPSVSLFKAWRATVMSPGSKYSFQMWLLEVVPRDPEDGRRKLTPASCSLVSTCGWRGMPPRIQCNSCFALLWFSCWSPWMCYGSLGIVSSVAPGTRISTGCFELLRLSHMILLAYYGKKSDTSLMGHRRSPCPSHMTWSNCPGHLGAGHLGEEQAWGK